MLSLIFQLRKVIAMKKYNGKAGFRLFSVDEKEPKVDLYIPPKRGDLQ